MKHLPPRATLASALLLLGLGTAAVAQADAAATDPAPLSFGEAETRLFATSDLIAASDGQARADQLDAEALKSLRYPVVSLDAQYLHYQKTLSVDLDDLKDNVSDSLTDAAGNIVSQLPAGTPTQLVDGIEQILGTAIPGLVNLIPDSFRTQYDDSLFHPTVSAVLPIYAGGAISAAQDVAQARASGAQAGARGSRETSTLQLVEAYFGQQLAARLLTLSQDNASGFDHHLNDADAAEKQGVISHATRMSVAVARDAAQRQLIDAQAHYDTACIALTSLLRASSTEALSTPLFVNREGAGTLATFLAPGNEPGEIAVARAAADAADAGVRLQRSRLRPQVYAFGEANLDRSEELPVEPDYIVGVGVHFTLLSNIDRRDTLSAAQSRAEAATHAVAEARRAQMMLVTRAHAETEAARKNFELLDTNIAAAEENLHLQSLSFREGLQPASALIDARNLLLAAQTERAVAAFRYDLSLAALLRASGQMDHFVTYAERPDRHELK